MHDPLALVVLETWSAGRTEGIFAAGVTAGISLKQGIENAGRCCCARQHSTVPNRRIISCSMSSNVCQDSRDPGQPRTSRYGRRCTHCSATAVGRTSSSVFRMICRVSQTRMHRRWRGCRIKVQVLLPPLPPLLFLLFLLLLTTRKTSDDEVGRKDSNGVLR